MVKICVIMGTRPEVIKCWPLIEELRARSHCAVQTLLTGQHRELTDQAIQLLQVPVTQDLNVMTAGQSLESLTARLCERISLALKELSPDWVLVQGDTTSVFIGALSAFYAGIKIGHVEAGLRSGDMQHPFPEEMNRRLTGSLANLHFAPTETAKQALLRENTPANAIFVTGNTGIDALRLMRDRLPHLPVHPQLQHVLQVVEKNKLTPIAVTVHRRENRPFMADIARACLQILTDHPSACLIFPVHFSPAIREAVFPLLGNHHRCHLLEPLDYANFVRLLTASKLVLTDSGGVQEEAPYLGKPVLILRRTTERPEAVDAGGVKVIGEQPDAIVKEVTRLLTDDTAYRTMAKPVTPYGDGFAAKRIADILLSQP